MKMKIAYLTPTSLFLIALAMGHAQFAIAGNSDAIKEAKKERDRIEELQMKQAETNGRILTNIDILIIQNQLIQDRLWKLKNGKITPSR